jgi:hypothetical protein
LEAAGVEEKSPKSSQEPSPPAPAVDGGVPPIVLLMESKSPQSSLMVEQARMADSGQTNKKNKKKGVRI